MPLDKGIESENIIDGIESIVYKEINEGIDY